MEPVFVPKTPHEKAMQRALMQWKRPEKRPLVLEALRAAHREDLIGYGKHCLVRPEHGEGRPTRQDKAAAPRRGGKKPRQQQAGSRGEHTTRPPQRKAGWAKPKPKPGKPKRSRTN